MSPSVKAIKDYVDDATDGISTDNLTYGHIVVGDSESKKSPIDASGEGKILVGTGATVTSVAVSGDVTINKDGKVTIGSNKIDGTHIKNASITKDDLENDAVITSRIQNNAVIAEKLASNAVTTAKIADDAVTDAKLATLSSIDIDGGSIDGVTLNQKDNAFTLQDEADVTKQAKFELTGITTNSTRTLTLPDADGTLALTSEITSSKTLTQGSVLVGDALGVQTALDAKTSGNILVGDGTTVKSVEVSGDATLVSGGALTIANDAVTTAKIADDAVTDAKLATLSSIDIDGGSIDGVTLNQKDNAFTLQDEADVTKQAKFELTGITTDNTRTLTLPDASGTIALTTDLASDFTGATAGDNPALGTAGLVPAPSTDDVEKFLKGDGTWAEPTNTTYAAFTDASVTAETGTGLVTKPSTANQNKFLRGDGQWVNVIAAPKPYVSQSRSIVFNLSQQKDVIIEGTQFSPDLQLENLPTGYTQVLKTVSPTSITITVTAPNSVSAPSSDITLSNHWPVDNTITFETRAGTGVQGRMYNGESYNVYVEEDVLDGGWLRVFKTNGANQNIGQQGDRTTFDINTSDVYATNASFAPANFYKGVDDAGIKHVMIYIDGDNYAIYNIPQGKEVAGKSIAEIYAMQKDSTDFVNEPSVSRITSQYSAIRDEANSTAFGDYPYFSFNLVSLEDGGTDNASFVFHNKWGVRTNAEYVHGTVWGGHYFNSYNDDTYGNDWDDWGNGAADGVLWTLQWGDYGAALNLSSTNKIFNNGGYGAGSGAGVKVNGVYSTENNAIIGDVSIFVK